MATQSGFPVPSDTTRISEGPATISIPTRPNTRRLAVATSDEGKKRETTAGRLMQRFADRPFSTWRTIELALKPYEARMQAGSDRSIGNLLDNAMRYAGEAGPIDLCIRREGRAALITVLDRGPGIHPEDHARVIQPFCRLAGQSVPGSALNAHHHLAAADAPGRGDCCAGRAGIACGTSSAGRARHGQCRGLQQPDREWRFAG